LFEFLHTTTLGKAIYLLSISMLPVVELRGGIPAAAMIGVPWAEAYVICVIGNMIPVPFIMLFLRQILIYLKGKKRFEPYIERLERSLHHKSKKVLKYASMGLFIFVAIPAPGTGAWTGAAIAAILDLRLKKAIPAIFAGVLVAGLIITGVSYGFLSIIL